MEYVLLPTQPAAVVTVQVIIDVPAATPVTTPVLEFTVAIEGALLDHTTLLAESPLDIE
jgi:hypothetical protein